MKTNWLIKKLGEVCDLVRGSEPGSAAYIKESIDTIPFLRVGDLSGKVDDQKYISKKFKNILIINPREILITFDGTPGIVTKGLYGAISSGIRVVRNIKQDEILKDFLFYYLQTPPIQETIRFYTIGVTILHASRSIPHIKIKIPPLSIQQKIVKRLDTIRNAQELNEKQISLTNELFQNQLYQELKPKKNWQIKKLKEVVAIHYGKGLARSERKENGKIFAYGSNGPVYKTDKILINSPTIVIGRKGAVGAVHLVETPCWPIDTTFYTEILDSNLIGLKFLYFILLIKKLEKMAIVTAVPGINRDHLYNIKICIPSLKTQHKIIEKLSAVQNYKKKLLKQKELLQELFESTLYRAMKGELIK